MSRLEEEWDVNLRAVRLVALIMKLLYMSHLIGCGWMAIATFADDPDQPSWITAFEHTRRQLRQKTDDTWDDIDDDVEYESEQAPLPLGTRYFLAFYWALCTLVGSGSPDVVPVTDSERKYDACIALLSALVFGYVIGEIGRLLASLDRQAMVLEQKMDAVKEFLAWRKVHSPLLSSPSISPTSSLSPLNLQPPTSYFLPGRPLPGPAQASYQGEALLRVLLRHRKCFRRARGFGAPPPSHA